MEREIRSGSVSKSGPGSASEWVGHDTDRREQADARRVRF